MGTTTGELGVTTYTSGEKPWSHSAGLQTIDDKVSDLMHGKLRDAVTVSSLASQPDLTSGVKGTGVLNISATSGTLSQFTNGTNEQFLFVYFSGATTPTVEHGTDADDISLQDSTDWSPSQYDWLILWKDTAGVGLWREVVRSSGVISTKTTFSSDSVPRTALKTATVNIGTLAVGSSVTISQMANMWGLCPPTADANGANFVWIGNGVNTAEIARARGGGDPAGAATNVTVRYLQASPPWHVDGEEWGSFAYVLRDTSTGEILNYLFAPDPLWYLGGVSIWDKNSPERIAEAPPHPFWFGDDWATRTRVPPPGQEVVLVDLREIDLAEDEFCLRKKRAKRYREMAAAKASQGRPLDEVLELAGKAEAEERQSNPVKGKAYLLRDDHAAAERRTAWSYVADTPQLLNATSQAKKKGKPIKFGVREVDDLVTIVSAG